MAIKLNTSTIRIVVVLMLYLQSLTKAYVITIPLKRSTDKISESVLSQRKTADLKEQVENLHGKPGLGYYIEMGIGSPAQMMNVLVDTGSSNFAVAVSEQSGAETFFNSSRSSTFSSQGTDVSVPYTQGKWAGFLAQDMVTIPGLNSSVASANIACITESSNFYINGSHWVGILGLAYAEIARPDSSVEPLFETMVRQGVVNNSFSMQLCGTVDTKNASDISMGGTLILGGMLEELYTGLVYYAHLYKPWYYEVILTDIKVDDQSLQMDCKEYNFDKTIVDSGTTNLRLPKRVFEEVIDRIKSRVQLQSNYGNIPDEFWEGSESAVLCPGAGVMPWKDFPVLELHLGVTQNSSFGLVVPPQQYLRAVKNIFDSTSNTDCYKFAISPSKTGTVIGAIVMEGFYVVFDRANSQIGFAETTCQHLSTPNQPHLIATYTKDGADNWDCAYIKQTDNQSTLITVAYVMAGICGACIIPLIVMIVHWHYVKWRQRGEDNTQDISGLLNEDQGDR